jgi:hypothetical protein
MTLAALNLLAFAWHAALDLLEPPWQAARAAAAKRTSFFAHLLIDDLCRLSFVGRFPRSPHHLHDPPGTAQNPENRTMHGPSYLELLIAIFPRKGIIALPS